MKLVGERRALAAAIMAFYFLFYGVIAYAQLVPDLTKAFVAIAGVYGMAFFALVAGYFWARWYAVGVGLYGVITAAVGMWQVGAEPVILFIGGTHFAATMFLWDGVEGTEDDVRLMIPSTSSATTVGGQREFVL